MLLLIDVGNTSTTYGFYEKGSIRRVVHVDSYKFPKIVRHILENDRLCAIDSAVVSSVVPKITHILRNLWSRRHLHNFLWIVGQNLPVKIRHNYKNIHKLGADRLVNSFGAIHLYGAPLLIMDFGTALTCDYISKKGIFEGGLIIPGPEISLRALEEKTALLPAVPFPKKKAKLIGRDTKEGMSAGILQGYGAMADGLIERFKAKYGRKLQAIATGGLAQGIRTYSTQINKVDPLLTLKSLYLAFKSRS